MMNDKEFDEIISKFEEKIDAICKSSRKSGVKFCLLT